MKYKNIPSLLHNFGHYFTSDMNMNMGEDGKVDFLSYLIAADLSKRDVAELTLTVAPPAILPSNQLSQEVEAAVLKSLTACSKIFAEMAESQAVDPKLISELTLRVKRRDPVVKGRRLACTVSCNDDRGQSYEAEVTPTL